MSNFETHWVQILPEAGTECPVCQQEILKEGKFGGVLCWKCLIAFKLSKFPPKDEVPPREIKTIPILRMDEKDKAEFLAEFKKLNERFDKLGLYLKEKLG